MQVNAEGARVETVRTFNSFVQVSGEEVGALPKILSLTANGEESDITGATFTDIDLKYTGRKADGVGSKAVQMSEKGFGFKAGDMNMQPMKSFSLAFWVKVNKYISDNTQFVDISDKLQGWPYTDWGWCWNGTDKEGVVTSIAFRKGAYGGAPELKYEYANNKIQPGPWTHMAYMFEYNDSQAFRFALYINGEKIAPSKWAYNGVDREGEPTFIPEMYGMRAANVVALGGPAKFRGGIDGSLDNFQYWEKAMTAEDVKLSMGTFNTANLPAELKGFWSIEKDAAPSGEFDNEVAGSTVKAGLHSYDATGAEGEGNFRWQSATYAPGCPFITGTAYPVVTEPTWIIYKGDISNNSGNALAGSAKVQFAEKGSYEATLTLKNGRGSDSKTFKYIVIDTEGSVDDINVETELQAYPNPFIDHVNVKFGAAGNYTVRIFNANGVMVNESNKTVDAGQFVQIGVNSGAGAYIAQILKDGKLVRAVKLLKK